jgi:hypothetical protein
MGPVSAWTPLVDKADLGIRACHSIAMRVNGTEMQRHMHLTANGQIHRSERFFLTFSFLKASL